MPDGKWNHGEGFGPSPIDNDGWFNSTDGSDLTLADIHVQPNDHWVPYTWNQPFVPTTGPVPAMRRMEGYLRPASIGGLPSVHPLYGNVGAYVDQAAFEIFRPEVAWNPNQKILLVVHCKETSPFPFDHTGKSYRWRQIYRGFFSKDGLVRNEVARTVAAFNATDAQDGDEVERPILSTLPFWNPTPTESYWPIEAYIVTSVMHRSTTLNEQRHLQLVQAIKLLLTAPDSRNPLADPVTLTVENPLLPADVEDKVVVVHTGGSNGGLQGGFAALAFPRIVHGAYAEVINPSYQRLYAEHDLVGAMTELTSPSAGYLVAEDDFLTWNQYVWAKGLEMHDMSLLRHFLSGTSYRPTTFMVGDEDTTSTGTNWIKVLHGSQWQQSGIRSSPLLTFGSPAAHTMAWSTSSGTRHAGNFGPLVNPHPPGGTTFYSSTLPRFAWPDVLAHRAAERLASQSAPAAPLQHIPRQPAQQMKGLDDPHEWVLGRLGEALPADVPPLTRDTGFVSAVNPGAAGVVLGNKEAMFIQDQRIYVGSADGFVSRLHVDTVNAKRPLVLGQRSQRLGHECFGLTMAPSGSSWSVIAATRRHLHRLDKDTLQLQQSVELPWETARPHHVRCADVLPGHAGVEIVFASVHGGLCFYTLGLQRIHEWTEPGIHDFVVDDEGVVTFVSSRGMIASVSFSGPNHTASLRAASKPIPQQLLEHGVPDEPPAQGEPVGDLQRMVANFGPFGFTTGVISLWTGDVDGNALRGHLLPGLQAFPRLSNLPVCMDVSTCMETTPTNDSTDPMGDHVLLLLAGSELRLYDQFNTMLGSKVLTVSAQGYYPFGAGAHHIMVGELVPNTGNYSEEVVIATNTGLMWMHINELVGTAPLPAAGTASGAFASGFWVEKNGPTAAPMSPALTTTHVQPRTNASLTATWAMARRPAAGGGLDPYLHILDQQGVYWKVGYNGQVQLWDASPVAAGAGVRGWDFVGTLSVSQSLDPECRLEPFGAIRTTPWCPRNAGQVGYQRSGDLSHYITDNWRQRVAFMPLFDGFVVQPATGAIVQKPVGFEQWRWTFLGDGLSLPPPPPNLPVPMAEWGNLVEGMHVGAGGQIDGIWASTHVLPPGSDRVDYLDLHSQNASLPAITQQSMAAVNLQTGSFANQTAVVLGCPGGRVRVMLPGSMRPDLGSPHQLGPTPQQSDDFGLGAAALAIRHEVDASGERIRIWVGTAERPCSRPQAYTDPYASLDDTEVSAGSIHTLTWTPGSGFTYGPMASLLPTGAQPRGASAVTGLLLADLLPTTLSANYAGDELVVATLSGDIIVYSADTLTERWRSHVPGSVGCYNSIRVEDLDGDTIKEIYLAGSGGLWRFVLPGELP